MNALIYTIDDQRFGIPVPDVDRTIRAVAITPILNAPATILGIFNLGGRVIPVLNMRHKLQLPPRKLALSDQFVITRTAENRLVALVVDAVMGVVDYTLDDADAGKNIDRDMPDLAGVIQLPDGMVLIYDLARFLGPQEEACLHDHLAEK